VLLRWDPSLPFECSEALLEAFRKNIGWKLPRLAGGCDNIGDAVLEYNKQITRDKEHDEEGHVAYMFELVANMAASLGRHCPCPPVLTSEATQNQDECPSPPEQEDEEESLKLKKCTPIY
jgi:hypothetical protein